MNVLGESIYMYMYVYRYIYVYIYVNILIYMYLCPRMNGEWYSSVKKLNGWMIMCVTDCDE